MADGRRQKVLRRKALMSEVLNLELKGGPDSPQQALAIWNIAHDKVVRID